MARRRTFQNNHIEALKCGEEYTVTIPDGGDLASMRNAIKHGQTLTFSPIINPAEVQVGDKVFLDWTEHGGTYMFHLVHEVENGRFLIANSLGKINGWVDGKALIARVTKVVDSEPRPEQEVILERLEKAYSELARNSGATPEDIDRLQSIVDDMRWYSTRISWEKRDIMPKSNMWSYSQILWHITKQAEKVVSSTSTAVLHQQIDYGKKHVGEVSEMLELLR